MEDRRHAAPRRRQKEVRRRREERREPDRARSAAPGRRPPERRRRRKPPKSLWKGARWWLLALLGLILLAALALGARSCGARRAAAQAEPSGVPHAPMSAFDVSATAPPIQTLEGSGGRKVTVGAIQADYTPPESVTVGLLKSVDLLSLGETVRANAAAAGWGEVAASLGENGELLLRNASQIVLGGGDFEKQEAFLTTDGPENLARTFLENSGLLPLLRERGLTLGLEAENDQGLITFRGRGNAPGEECSIAFSFLYTGAFNQAVLRATHLEGAVTTDRLRPLRKAAENAVTWSSADEGAVTVTEVELRSIRGLPFYVLTGSDGTVAYALAVEESVLDAVPGAREAYQAMMQSGIQEYVEIAGAG